MVEGEAEYYRAVEDFFAALRGVPHLLSPKDIQLLRGWFREGIPLHAVTSAMAETMARRRERGETDPVVSLGYCRHAVRAKVRQLEELAAGGDVYPPAPDTPPVERTLAELASHLDAVASGLPPTHAAVAVVLTTLSARVRDATQLPANAVEQYLFALETTLLVACWHALPAADAERLERAAAEATAASGATGEAVARTRRALRDRALRELLGLPRLELP